MALVLTKRYCCVLLVDDQGAVEEFVADAADEAFGYCVGPRCPYWCLDSADATRVEHRVERGGELGVAIADKEPDAAHGVVEIH